MGTTTVVLEVAKTDDRSRWETVECLVDSEASYSVIPAPLLERLGIEPAEEQEFPRRTAAGSDGDAAAPQNRFRGRIGFGDVIFCEEGGMSLLGVLTLKSMRFSLDPVRRELLDPPLLLAGVDRPQ